MTTTPTASPELPDLDRLEALARAATPGPWVHRHDPGNPPGVQHGVKLHGELGTWIGDFLDNADRVTEGGSAGERNAAFVAAANPAAVLALIALARRAQPEGEDSYTVDHRELAGKILSFSGISSRGSLEPGADPLADRLAEKLAGWGVAFGQPEGEAPQAEPVAAGHFTRNASGAWNEVPRSASNVAVILYHAQGWPTAQHAESGAPAMRTLEIERDAARSAVKEYCARIERLEAALAAQSQGAHAAQLSIGFANNDQGVHISVVQHHADGSATLLHEGRVLPGDSVARFALAAKAEELVADPYALDDDDEVRFPNDTQVAIVSAKRYYELRGFEERAQQAAAPGSKVDRFHWSKRGMELDPNGYYIAYSAPGTPEAPAEIEKALRELMSIVRIHSDATDENFAWAEIQYAEEVLRAAQLDGGQGEGDHA